MAYLRPNAFVQRVFDPRAVRFGLGGAETLAVRRRRGGGEQRVPVIRVEVGGVRRKAGKTVEGYWAKLPDPADRPVFTVTPA